jgi:hypothetical protein
VTQPADGRLRRVTPDAPRPGSHDRSTPTGSLEESAADLFEAMLAARDAEERGEADGPALRGFYRALMTSTLLLPVPPDHGDEAKAALEAAVNDDQEVEISVMLAADADGRAISVCFASFAALSAWAPRGTASLPIPARIAIGNMAAAGVPAIMDPAGPVPYRFEPPELAALARGEVPGSGEPIFQADAASSVRVSLPGPETVELERQLAASLHRTEVDAAWLVASDSAGRQRLLLGLLGGEGASAVVDVPDGTDVVWLEEPMLSSVSAVAEPFYRRR